MPASGAKVILLGNSNVGKSSLTNFFVGRRAIAYTSKTPGKTQQYNYFVVNEGRLQVTGYRLHGTGYILKSTQFTIHFTP